MKLPSTPEPGNPLEAAWGREVLNYLRSITPMPSPTVIPRQGPNGTVFDARPRQSQNPYIHARIGPYQFLRGEYLTGRLHPGTINGTYPTYAATPLDANPTIDLPDDAVTHIYLKLNLLPGPSAATVKYLYEIDEPPLIEIAPATPSDTGISYADTAGTAHWRLARVTTANGLITNITQDWTGHLWYVWSNGGHLWAGRPQ